MNPLPAPSTQSSRNAEGQCSWVCARHVAVMQLNSEMLSASGKHRSVGVVKPARTWCLAYKYIFGGVLVSTEILNANLQVAVDLWLL